MHSGDKRNDLSFHIFKKRFVENKKDKEKYIYVFFSREKFFACYRKNVRCVKKGCKTKFTQVTGI